MYPDLPSSPPASANHPAPVQTNFITATTREFLEVEKEKYSTTQIEIYISAAVDVASVDKFIIHWRKLQDLQPGRYYPWIPGGTYTRPTPRLTHNNPEL